MNEVHYVIKDRDTFLHDTICESTDEFIFQLEIENGSATLYYYQKIPALSGSVTTNWLLAKSPETYLYAALIEGAIYLRDEDSGALSVGVPIYGTMAHSYIQAHRDEAAAFAAFARAQPDNAILLIDTYDTERAAHEVVRLAPALATEGIPIAGVRIDSGDLAEHARRVVRMRDGRIESDHVNPHPRVPQSASSMVPPAAEPA